MVSGGDPRITLSRQFRGRRLAQAGFTYIGLMFAVAIAGIALAGTGVLWQMESRREKEKELLFIGEQYRSALTSYYEKSLGSDKQFPEKLEDLIKDNRFPMPVQHLRRLYRDPMTPEGDWELIRVQGRINGVASKSLQTPIKIAGFLPEQEEFEAAKTYADWRFISYGGSQGTQPAVANTPAGGVTVPGGGGSPLR